MSESSENSGGVPPSLPVTSPVASPTPSASGLPQTGHAPEGYKGPTVSTPTPRAGVETPKLKKLRLKKEAMGYHAQSGYIAPGGEFIGTEGEVLELGERVEVLGDAEEGDTLHGADPDNLTKNKPVGVEKLPGGQTPV